MRERLRNRFLALRFHDAIERGPVGEIGRLQIARSPANAAGGDDEFADQGAIVAANFEMWRGFLARDFGLADGHKNLGHKARSTLCWPETLAPVRNLYAQIARVMCARDVRAIRARSVVLALRQTAAAAR